MNSHESTRGFISFVILSAVIGLSVLSLRYISNSTNLISMASNEALKPQFIEVNSVLNDSATVNWYTASATIGILIYSDNKNCFEDKKNNYQNCELLSEPEATKNHSIQLNNLNPGSTYYYKIKGDNFVHPEIEPLMFTTLDTDGFGSETILESTPNEAPEEEGFAPISSAPSTPASIQESTIKSTLETDFEGFGEANDDQVLGISTVNKTQLKISASIIEEFREALVYNNLKYDFDKNGKVENQDYALFIQFISNKED